MTDVSTERLVGRREVLLAALATGAGLALAACAAPVAPSWTFAPAPRPTGSAAADPTAGEDASPAPSDAGGPTVVRIVAENFAFDLAEFKVPADTPFKIEFDHRDVGIPHNVAIYESSPEGVDLFRGEIFSGPDVVIYDVPGLPIGEHAFICDPHPYMLGTVVVG